MRNLALEIAVAAALTVAAILSLAAIAHANEIMVKGAYARASASSSAKAGAAYFTIANHGAQPDRIIAATTDVASSAMIHENRIENGVATMHPVESVDLAPMMQAGYRFPEPFKVKADDGITDLQQPSRE